MKDMLEEIPALGSKALDVAVEKNILFLRNEKGTRGGTRPLTVWGAFYGHLSQETVQGECGVFRKQVCITKLNFVLFRSRGYQQRSTSGGGTFSHFLSSGTGLISPRPPRWMTNLVATAWALAVWLVVGFSKAAFHTELPLLAPPSTLRRNDCT
jgi:hypothetical protein